MTKCNNSKWKNRGRIRPDPSDPEMTKGSFRCMVSIDRSTYPPSFIRQAGCHTSLGFPRRCQPLLHTIEQANSFRVCHLQGRFMRDFICGAKWYTCPVHPYKGSQASRSLCIHWYMLRVLEYHTTPAKGVSQVFSRGTQVYNSCGSSDFASIWLRKGR